jgi:hypothetical protein
MANRFSFPALALGAALLAAGPTGLGPTDALAQGCLSQAEARAAVSSGQAAPFSAFSGSLRSMGQVVSSCLAQQGGGYVYVVKIVQPNGQVISQTIRAN